MHSKMTTVTHNQRCATATVVNARSMMLWPPLLLLLVFQLSSPALALVAPPAGCVYTPYRCQGLQGGDVPCICTEPCGGGTKLMYRYAAECHATVLRRHATVAPP